MLDAMIASSLKKLINTQSTFRDKSKRRRATNSKFRPILARKTNCVHDLRVFPCNWRLWSQYEDSQTRSRMSLQNDDVQDFDVRWDQALLSVSEMPSDPILVGLYKSKLQNYPLNCGLWWHCMIRNLVETTGHRTINNWILQWNFILIRWWEIWISKARNDVVERGSVTKSQKGNKAYVERKVREYTTGLCISKIHIRESLFYVNPGKWWSKHAVKFSKYTWHQIKIRERKGPSRGIIHKCEPHERSPCAPKFEDRSHEEPWPKNDAPAKQCGICRKYIYKLKCFGRSKVFDACHFEETRKAINRSRFRSSDAHDEQKKNWAQKKCGQWKGPEHQP